MEGAEALGDGAAPPAEAASLTSAAALREAEAIADTPREVAAEAYRPKYCGRGEERGKRVRSSLGQLSGEMRWRVGPLPRRHTQPLS